MLDAIRSDVRHLVGQPGGRWRTLRALPDFGLHALAVYRLGRWIRGAPGRPARWIPALLLAPAYVLAAAYVRLAYDIRLDQSASIGPGLKIFHFGRIRLRRCSVGAGCVLHQGVRVEPGAGGGPGPQIGDRVWIGPHARIVGPVRVGDGVAVSAGALVTQDVGPRSLVVGCPARVTLADYDNGSYL